MPDQFAKGAMPRVVLLARAGKAADNIADALRRAGAQLVLTADPSQTDETTLRAHDPQVLLVALEPSIEQALDKFEALLIDPALTVIYDEADLAAHRAGWDAARWARHLSAKMRHDDNVLPPGTESDHDWQLSPGQIPKPSAAYDELDLAMFTREAVASAHRVPTDGMPAEPLTAPYSDDALTLDAALLDTIPEAQPGPPPEAPPAVEIEIESFEAASAELAALIAAAPEPVAADVIEDVQSGGIQLESTQFESMQLKGMQFESMPPDSDDLEDMTLESMPLESMQLEAIEFEAREFGNAAAPSSGVAPMNLDNDAFFLEELSLGDAAPVESEVAPMRLDGGFDTDLDVEADDSVVTMPVPVDAQREFEDALSFDTFIAGDAPAAESARPEPHPARSLGGLSLAPVDEAPAIADKPAAASPPVHDLSVLEARISGLSLVDLDAAAQSDTVGVVLVEAGLGGPDPARQLLSSIPAEFPAVVLVRLHLQGGRYDRLVAQMERAAALPVALAQNGAGANPGTIYFLPDGIGLVAHSGGFEFTADGAPAEHIFTALPPTGSAIVFLSGSDMQLVDTAMGAAARGTLVIAQSAEDCYDGTACAELRKRGAASGLPAELAGRLASRWPG